MTYFEDRPFVETSNRTVIDHEFEQEYEHEFEQEYESETSPTPGPTEFPYDLDDLDHFLFNKNNDMTPHQELILGWIGRVAGIFSLVGGIYICYWSWKRREHVYHRLMFAVSMYILLWSPWMIYGIAALPEGTPEVLGASGTTATCTAQGIVTQLSTAIPAYYVGLSGVAWAVVVGGNFDPSRYAWVENYIHVGVNGWAILSSSILASLEAFNPTEGWPSCYIGALPQGCGFDFDFDFESAEYSESEYSESSAYESGIPCERGPDNIKQIMGSFVGIPVLFLLLFPTIAMITLAGFLYWRAYRQRNNANTNNANTNNTNTNSNNTNANNNNEHGQHDTITARAVTKQSAVYLGTLYFIYTPSLAMTYVGNFGGEKQFLLSAFGTAITVSAGFWYALVYRYFSSSQGAERGIVDAYSYSYSYSNTAKRRVSKSKTRMEPTRITLRGSCSRAFSLGDNASGHLDVDLAQMDEADRDDPDLDLDRDPDRDRDPIGTSINSTQSSVMAKDESILPDETETETPTSAEASQQSTGRGRRDASCQSQRSQRSAFNSNNSNSKQRHHHPPTTDEFRKSFDFNIFDGTAPSQSQWAAFIFDGDESDEEADLEDTRHWEGCQDI